MLPIFALSTWLIIATVITFGIWICCVLEEGSVSYGTSTFLYGAAIVAVVILAIWAIIIVLANLFYYIYYYAGAL